eukprot:sb/3475664/
MCLLETLEMDQTQSGGVDLSEILRKHNGLAGVIIADRATSVIAVSAFSDPALDSLSSHRPFVLSTMNVIKNTRNLGIGEAHRIFSVHSERNIVNICLGSWVIILIGAGSASLGELTTAAALVKT